MGTLLHLIGLVDQRVYYFLSSVQGNWYFDRLANHLESNTLLKAGPIIATFWYFWFIDDSDQRERRSSILTIFTGTFLALGVTRLVASLVSFRTRPMYDASILHRPLSIPVPTDFVKLSSFPSDHAAYFAALGLGLICLSRRLLFPVIAYISLWICLPRLYLGIHYASDMLVGAAIGLFFVWGCLSTDWIQSNVGLPVLGFAEAKPQIFYPAAFLITFEMGTMFLDVRELERALQHLASVGRYSKATEAILLACICLLIVLFTLRRHRMPTPHSDVKAIR